MYTEGRYIPFDDIPEDDTAAARAPEAETSEEAVEDEPGVETAPEETPEDEPGEETAPEETPAG